MLFDRKYVVMEPSEDTVRIVSSFGTIPIVVDPQEEKCVHQAVKDLQQDIEKVANQKPAVLSELPDRSAMIVATVENTIVQALDVDVSDIEGKNESFLIETIQDIENGEDLVVIIGSDPRGAIFGVYDFTEKVGISPWYWWMDVPVQKHESVYVKRGSYIKGEPSVSSRGFCLNGEESSLTNWVNSHFSGCTPDFYEKIFELILRLKGNTYCPAPLDVDFDKDPLKKEKAEEYGVLIKGNSSSEKLASSIQQIGKQMNEAIERKASQVWLGNVRKLKLFEFQTEFFLKFAWDMESFSSETFSEYTIAWAEYTFGTEYGKKVATIIQDYMNNNKFLEQASQNKEIYSWDNDFKAEKALSKIEKTVQLAELLLEEMPDQYKDAYYQVAYYPARVAYIDLKCQLMENLSQKLAEKELPAANIAAGEAEWLVQERKTLALDYNQRFSFGKWDHVITISNNEKLPKISQVPEKAFKNGEWLAEVVNGAKTERNSKKPIVVDIYNKGKAPISLLIAGSNDWLRIPSKLLEIKLQGRIKVLVDWKNAPKGDEVKGSITLQDDKGKAETIPLTVHNPEDQQEYNKQKPYQPEFKEDYTVLPGDIPYIKKAALVYVEKPGWYQFISEESVIDLETIDGLNAMAVENEGQKSYYLSAGTHIIHVIDEAVDIEARLLKESNVDIRPTFRVQETTTEKNEWVVQVGIHNRDLTPQDYSIIGEINHLPFVVADRFGTKGVLKIDGQQLHTFTFLNEEILDAVVLNINVNVEGWERTELFEFSFAAGN